MKYALLTLMLIVSLTGIAAAQDAPFEPSPCPFPPLDGVTCGVLIVPEDHSDPNSPEIELMVAIIESRSSTPAEPVIYLEGGPGGSALFAVEDYTRHPLRDNHDLILFDQRGTGFSQPSLNCYEMEDFEEEDGLTACYERLLDEGINLDAYNSAASAADVDALRRVLGYEQVNLWGISYGTRLALTVMRDYPANIRAVVIDSVYPPEINSIEQGASDSIRAFDTLFAACAADPMCSSEYPTLEDDFYTMVDDFNFDPPVFEYDDGFEVYELELFGDDILEGMFQTLYDSPAIPMLPYGITLLANAQDDFDYQDGYDIILGFWTPETWAQGFTDGAESVYESDMVMDYMEEYGDISDSEGVYNAVECAEEVHFNDLDAAFNVINTAPPPLQEWLYQSAEEPFFDCEVWEVARSGAVENEPVVSDIPTLLISGEFDPITPPSYAESALRTLSNGQHIVFPTGAHGESGDVGCAADIASAFLADPTASLDTSCIPQQVKWYVE